MQVFNSEFGLLSVFIISILAQLTESKPGKKKIVDISLDNFNNPNTKEGVFQVQPQPTIQILCDDQVLQLDAENKASCSHGQLQCTPQSVINNNNNGTENDQHQIHNDDNNINKLECSDNGKLTAPKCERQLECLKPVDFIVACDLQSPFFSKQPTFKCEEEGDGEDESEVDDQNLQLPKCENGKIVCKNGRKLEVNDLEGNDFKIPCQLDPKGSLSESLFCKEIQPIAATSAIN